MSAIPSIQSPLTDSALIRCTDLLDFTLSRVTAIWVMLLLLSLSLTLLSAYYLISSRIAARREYQRKMRRLIK